MNTDKIWFRLRNGVGVLGVLLPLIAVFGAGLNKHFNPDMTNGAWWWSISATYYQTPALVAILSSASVILMAYDGYDWRDSLVTTLAGVFGMGIVLFPCSVGWIPKTQHVGFFQLPMKYSNIVHVAFAFLFFTAMAINSLFLFTIGENNPTPQKKIRNIIYRVCGIGMIATMVLMIILMNILDGWVIFVAETIMLLFFGFSWLTKGGCWLRDKQKEENDE